jgi:sugar O-acyltransferase (sialic acid O-acetyltransferase NeuD family)
MKVLETISIEQDNVNDESVVIKNLYYESGDFVEKDSLLLDYETSKASHEIHSSCSGYVHYLCDFEDIISVGSSILKITNAKIDETVRKVSIDMPKTVNFSKKALEKIKKLGLSESLFSSLERVTAADVEEFSRQNVADTYDVKVALNEKSLLILGGGGHAKMCIEVINQMNLWEIAGITDPILPINSKLLGVQVIGKDNIIDSLISQGLRYAILGVGGVLNPRLRNKLFILLKSKNLEIPNIIHPSASIEESVKLGEGNQIMQGAIIGSSVNIGDNCIINSGSIVSHDAVISDNVHIAPGATIAGSVTIGNNTIVGMGVTIFLGVRIGENVIIKNGMDIFTNIPDNTKVT